MKTNYLKRVVKAEYQLAAAQERERRLREACADALEAVGSVPINDKNKRDPDTLAALHACLILTTALADEPAKGPSNAR